MQTGIKHNKYIYIKHLRIFNTSIKATRVNKKRNEKKFIA